MKMISLYTKPKENDIKNKNLMCQRYVQLRSIISDKMREEKILPLNSTKVIKQKAFKQHSFFPGILVVHTAIHC